ncbi:MAG: glycosyltransferase family 39 protein [Planctomycetaceae bacterium]
MFAVLRRHPLLVILAAALTLRLVAAIGVQSHLDATGRQFLLAGDAEGYWMLAGRLAVGDEYAVYDPPRRVLRMPGLPLLLAGVRVVTGDSLLAVRVVLACVGTAACAAVYLLGRTLDSEKTGLIAAALATCWPVLIGFSVLVLSETLFALLLTLSLVATARLVKRRPVATGITSVLRERGTGESSATVASKPMHLVLWAVLTGIGISAATYVRPTWLPAAAVVPAVYWFWAGRTRASALAGVLIVVAAAMTIAPWTIRNRIVTGRWIPTTLWVGPSLYDGLNPNATGASDMRFFDEDRLLDRMTEYEMDREYRQRAWEFAVENPERVVALAFAKMWRYWRPWPGAEQFSTPLAQVAVAAYYLPMLVLAAIGGWTRRRDVWLVGLSVAPLLFFSLVHCVFVGSLRYRLPAEYPLCMLSAVGLQWFFPQRASTSVGKSIV